MDSNMFTHQAFVFRNERQELVTAMVSVPCQLSANSQPHGGYSYLSSTMGTPPALIPAYSYIPIQSVGRQTAAVRSTNDNMIGDLFFLGPNQSQEYAYQAVGNNGVQYAHPVPVTSGHNSTDKGGKARGGTTTTQAGVTGRLQTASSLNAHQTNGDRTAAAALGSIDLPNNNVTVLQSGRVVQDLENKNDEDNIIRNSGRKLSTARRRISSSSEEDNFFGATIKTEDVSESEESPMFSDDDSPSSAISQSTHLLHGDYGAYYNVTCGEFAAQFHVSRFARGSIGKCILYEGVWYTPNAFQSIAGRQCSKDWKRSIRCGQQCLRDMIREGKFQEHPKSCTCGICFSIADAVAARDLHNSRVNQVILAKKRRLSQTDSGKSRKPAVPMQAAKASPPQVNGTSTEEPVKMAETSSQENDNGEDDGEDLAPSDASFDIVNEVPSVDSPEPNGTTTNTELDSIEEDEEDPRSKIPTEPPIPSTSFHTEAGAFIKNPRHWNCDEVLAFLQHCGFPHLQNHFKEHEVDGQCLLLLNEGHLMETFNMKLGTALKLLEAVDKLKHPPT